MPADGRGASAGSMKGTLGLTETLGHKSVLDKQRSAIEKLRTQNDQLKTELLLENKFSVRPGDPFAQALINRLQDEGDMLARKIVLEMRKLKMLDQQLGEMQSMLTTTRSNMGSIFSAKEQSQGVLKRIKLLENRLEKAYVKKNQSETYNKQLREQINNLRRERIMFESINSNLERELQKLKREMAETIQLANIAFEAKEKALQEMNSLKVQSEKEQAGFEEEWKQLTAIIDDDKRERERARQQELVMRERETQELLKAGSLGSDKKKKVSKGQWGVGFNKALAQNVAAEKVEMYGQAFKKIQEATRIEDIDQLVNTFLSAEDHNYTLFNYVNEVNQEIEKLEDQIVVIKSEVNKYREEGAELDRSKSAQAHDMEQKAAATGISSQLYEVRFASATSTMEALRNGISDIFNAIGCNTVAVRDLLGDDGVTDGNLLAYLGIVEQRTTEILQTYAARKAREGQEGLQEALLAQPLGAATNKVVIEPPSTTQEEEIEPGMEPEPVEDERPLTREHLESRVMRTLPKKLETHIKIRPIGHETQGKRSPARR